MTRGEVVADSRLHRFQDWPTLLEEVRTHPGLWLGRASITALRHFIDGFQLAEQVYGVPPERMLDGFPFEDFEQWLQERFPNSLALKSFNIAAREAGTDAAGFDLWFNWWDEFRASRADAPTTRGGFTPDA